METCFFRVNFFGESLHFAQKSFHKVPDSCLRLSFFTEDGALPFLLPASSSLRQIKMSFQIVWLVHIIVKPFYETHSVASICPHNSPHLAQSTLRKPGQPPFYRWGDEIPRHWAISPRSLSMSGRVKVKSVPWSWCFTYIHGSPLPAMDFFFIFKK